MSFNSLEFLLGFLPLVLIVYYALSLTPLHRLRLPFLVVATLLFYARAQPRYIPLLVLSIVANYLIAVLIVRSGSPRGKQMWLVLGIVANAGTLLYLKYFSVVSGAVTGVFGARNPFADIIAPLAISFYTFQQIGFLVDVGRGRIVPDGLMRYMAFVSFFPTLISGPISLHQEVAPQLAQRPERRRVAENLLIGLVIFSFGLFKKTVLADTAALWADPVFNAAQTGARPGFLLSWGAAFTYTLQIYFDFSGYSDMAIGVARMLGIVLPLNFFSPLRSTSVVDLWRRWHMTLGRFVRMYIHQPLMIPLTRLAVNGNLGKWPTLIVSVLVPTFLSMLIIGTWHGPSWTFVVFGLMHGTFMCINEIYSVLTKKKRRKKKDSRAALFVYGLLTLLAFVSAEVPFRSDSMSAAWRIFGGMVGLHGIGIAPDWATNFAPGSNVMMIPIIVLGLSIVYFFPNTEQIMDRVRPALEWEKWRIVDPARISFRFGFNLMWIAAVSVVLFFGFAFLSRGTSTFIYFKF
jgi:D-alanyl-lipoteichoic acid acyltransferase DltB (MBOAT superfamily)